MFVPWKQANLESLPPHVPSYLKAAVGPPSSTCRRHFCTVCGFSSNYTCVRCGMRFCSIRCQTIHDDTRCLKFVAWLMRLELVDFADMSWPTYCTMLDQSLKIPCDSKYVLLTCSRSSKSGPVFVCTLLI